MIISNSRAFSENLTYISFLESSGWNTRIENNVTAGIHRNGSFRIECYNWAATAWNWV